MTVQLHLFSTLLLLLLLLHLRPVFSKTRKPVCRVYLAADTKLPQEKTMRYGFLCPEEPSNSTHPPSLPLSPSRLGLGRKIEILFPLVSAPSYDRLNHPPTLKSVKSYWNWPPVYRWLASNFNKQYFKMTHLTEGLSSLRSSNSSVQAYKMSQHWLSDIVTITCDTYIGLWHYFANP